jgi:hypothetical protein
VIAAIDGFLKPLDWRLRSGMAAAFAALAAAIMAYALRSTSLGPWPLAMLCGIASTLSVWMAQKSWPSRLPGAAGLAVDTWNTLRGRATKTGSGRFLWGLGRMAVGAFVASKALGWIPGASEELGWVAMLGFGVSYGFFGLESAMWGMIVTATVAHVGLSFGMGMDVSDPVARRAFMEAWTAGSSVSWFWAFAFALTPFCWIGVSAVIGRTKKSIMRSAKKRNETAIAKRKIDARKARLSGAPGIGGDTALDKARAKLEEAKTRLKSFDKGGTGTTIDGMDASASADGGKELTGVEKLENDNMVGTLRTYVAQVATIRQVEAQGLDVDTPARRGFDRVIMALGDSAIELMRRDQTGFYKDLLNFYLALCEGESTVLRGTDGEIVTSVSLAPAFDEEDEIDGMSGSGWNVQSPPSEEIGGLGDVMDDEDEEEIPPPPPTPPALPVFDEPEEPAMMLAPSISEPLVVTDENPLLLEEDVDEDETSSMHLENVPTPEVVEHDRDEDSDHGVEGPVVEPVVPMPAAVVEGGSVDEDGVRSDDGDDHGPAEPYDEEVDPDAIDGPSEPVEPAEPAERVEPVEPVETAEPDAVHPDETPSIPATVAESASSVDVGAGEQENVENDVSNAGVPSAAELKAAATKILMMRTNRDMVVASAGWFSSTGDLAAAMGIDDDEFSEAFEAYHGKVLAFGLENQLRALTSSSVEEDDADRLDEASAALVSAGWDHDADLVAEAAGRSASIREAARIKREEEQAAIARAEAEAAEAEAKAEAAAQEAAAEAAAAAQRIADEAERVRLESVANAAAEAERTAAAERAKALESRRGKIAVQILLGRLTDAVVEDAIDLFDNAQSLADELDIDLETAQEKYDAFASARDARLKYRELVAAFRAEDVSMVEALLKDETSFDGYTPTEMPIADIRKWAEGVRVRERLDGLVDGNKDVVETGNVTRRRFMMKRTGVTDAMAAVVDEEIPRELRAAKGLRDAMKNLGEFVPDALLVLLADAEARAAVLARSLLDQTNPKMKIGEYAAAYLPHDVRVDGEDAWEMLVRMAASAVLPVEQAPAVEAAPVAPEPEPVVAPASAPAPAAAPEESSTPDRIRMSTPIGFKGARTFEEVSALNAEKEIRKIPKGTFDMNRFFNQQRIALRGYLGDRTDQLVSLDEGLVYVSIPGKDGSILGRVRVQAKSLAFAWFEQPEAVWFKDVISGETRKLQAGSVERQASPFMNAPNGDPETIIGFVLMSALVTPDGMTSVGPFVKSMGPRYTILSVNDSGGLCAFMAQIAAL